MPIPDDLKQHYPDNWPELREAVLERTVKYVRGPDVSAHCCEWCGKPNGYPYQHTTDGWRIWYEEYNEDGLWTVAAEFDACDDTEVDQIRPRIESAPDEVPDDATTVVLTVAHLCQDPRCDNLDHLRALCQRCHLQYDQQPDQRERRRRIQAEIRGQQTLAAPAGCDGGELEVIDP